MTRLPRPRSRGFTLVEMVVAITISTILLGVVAMTTTAPVDQYLAQSRRNEAMNASDRIVLKMADDLKHALPNSVRRGRFASTDVLQLLDVDSILYYQEATGADTTSLLRFDAVAGDTFDAYGRVSRSPLRLVVGNRGTSGYDAYELTAVISPAAAIPTTAALGAKRITLDAAFFFPTQSPTNRVFAIRGPITYVCNRQTGMLTRFEGHAIAAALPTNEGAAQLNSPGATATVVASGISGCRIDCVTVIGSAQTCSTSVAIDIQLRRGVAPDDETINLFRQFVVDNTR